MCCAAFVWVLINVYNYKYVAITLVLGVFVIKVAGCEMMLETVFD